ncbi:DUF421 domain-containing protein [Alicyclobacillus sp.]|uniref:DUF421 domain-containing protein n=1 Tax=Alicyclobacillus sp. TaxID=61169 RepID=UPI0025B8BFA7|nr:YetF domain-containing protein [Alicyclobacillus sp.]MCL6515452.1 DUF421 domain-containing protein [Alicyclobacillus sp.]
MHVAWGYLTVSTLVTFAVLLGLVRWIGSTQLTQLTFFNWVAGASMGNLAANMIGAGNTRDWVAACYSLVVFTAATVLAATLALKVRGFRRVAGGEPVVLIHKGTILRENLKRTKVNLDVLMMLLREKGYFSYGDIEYAILEPTGNLSILPTQESQSASKADLVKGPDLSDRGQGPYVELVVDGELDRDKLRETGRDEAWVMEQVRRLGGRSLEDVTYLGVNRQGEVIGDVRRRLAHPKDPRV